MPKLKAEYIETGKLKYVFRDFPLSFHKDALNAAKAASCAGEQSKYWEMHDTIFKNQKKISTDDLELAAKDLGLDMDSFDMCIKSDKYDKEASGDMTDGLDAGVKGTPSFFVGYTDPDSKEIKGKFIRGAQPYTVFKRILDDLLSQAESE